MQTRRRFLASAAATTALGSLGLSAPAQAQGWPQRPIKVIVAFAPGGNSDSIARIACRRLSEAFPQAFYVENRPGNGGALGAEEVMRSAPDGYTLFVAATPQMAVTPVLRKVSYDPLKDFAPISDIGSNPFVLTVNARLPIKNVADFVAYARARPGRVTFGSGGAGTLNHLSMMLFSKRAGINLVNVPYKGGAPAMIDLVGGQINAMFATLADALGQAPGGKVRLLAVSSVKRVPQAPDVPTVSESGYPGFKTISSNGLVAPAKTPKDIINRISAEVQRAAKDPKFVKQLAHIGVTAIGDTPEEYAATLKEDVALWAEAVKLAGLKRH
jgi:tripartite-type tricarboxylate transporter receptor subunit TctC